MNFSNAMCCTLLSGVVCLPAMAANGTNFNPDISLIIDGRFSAFENGSDYELPGFMLGGEAGRGKRGLAIGHNELAMSANIDDRFFGKFTSAVADHEGETVVELEEAYIETLGLGYGLTVKAGRFLSALGYLNSQHGHVWDFTDAPLVYQGLFGNQLIDDGLQISWLAPVDGYFKLGAEVGRGERFPAGGAANDGMGSRALFAKLGGDIGVSQSWQLGIAQWRASVEGRAAGAHSHGGVATEIPSYFGDSVVNTIDFVWKWAPGGNSAYRSIKLQAEYLQREEDGRVDMLGSDPPESSSYQGRQSGWYMQLVYQFIPRWRVAVRYDQLLADNSGSDAAVLSEAGLDDEGVLPQRSTVMLDYSRSEYSRLRLQYAVDNSYEDADRIIFLQYIMSLGAHGAHQY